MKNRKKYEFGNNERERLRKSLKRVGKRTGKNKWKRMKSVFSFAALLAKMSIIIAIIVL